MFLFTCLVCNPWAQTRSKRSQSPAINVLSSTPETEICPWPSSNASLPILPTSRRLVFVLHSFKRNDWVNLIQNKKHKMPLYKANLKQLFDELPVSLSNYSRPWSETSRRNCRRRVIGISTSFGFRFKCDRVRFLHWFVFPARFFTPFPVIKFQSPNQYTTFLADCVSFWLTQWCQKKLGLRSTRNHSD